MKQPTISRFLYLLSADYSLLRTLQHEILLELELHGNILDIGGGLNTSYARIIDGKGNIFTFNMSTSMHPTIVGNIKDGLPLKNEFANHVISLNTVQLISDLDTFISESMRVLCEGGRLHIFAPFLYPRHDVPLDSTRLTEDEWMRILNKHEIDANSIDILPIAWDPISTAGALVEIAIPRYQKLLRPFILFPALIYTRFKSSLPENARNFALGYYITAVKKGQV